MPEIEPMSDRELADFRNQTHAEKSNYWWRTNVWKLLLRLDATKADADRLKKDLKDAQSYRLDAIQFRAERDRYKAVVERLNKALVDGDFLCDCYDEYNKKRPTAPCTTCQLDTLVTSAESQEDTDAK